MPQVQASMTSCPAVILCWAGGFFPQLSLISRETHAYRGDTGIARREP
jgi:hypothetical protein